MHGVVADSFLSTHSDCSICPPPVPQCALRKQGTNLPSVDPLVPTGTTSFPPVALPPASAPFCELHTKAPPPSPFLGLPRRLHRARKYNCATHADTSRQTLKKKKKNEIENENDRSLMYLCAVLDSPFLACQAVRFPTPTQPGSSTQPLPCPPPCPPPLPPPRRKT